MFIALGAAPFVFRRAMLAYYADMADPNEAAVYYVRAINPAKNEHIAFKCAGMATAHAKAAELRMTGHRDVVMSVSDPSGGSVQEADVPLLAG